MALCTSPLTPCSFLSGWKHSSHASGDKRTQRWARCVAKCHGHAAFRPQHSQQMGLSLFCDSQSVISPQTALPTQGASISDIIIVTGLTEQSMARTTKLEQHGQRATV
jgi:hypothetical protein